MVIPYFYNWESLDTMFNNHLMKACLAAVFAIGLAACSSSSDTSSTTPDPAPDPGPTQEEQLLAALQQQIAALRQQLGIDDSTDIGTTIADLQKERDALQKQLDDQAAEATMKEALAIAAMLAAGTPAGADNSAGLGAPPDIAATAVRTASGTKITVTGGTGTFKSTDMVAAPMISGLASDVQTRKTAATQTTLATEETVAVYTDIMAPESKSADFDDYYSDTDDGAARLAADGLASYATGAVTLLGSIPATARAKFTSSMFPMGSRKSYTYGTGDDDKADASGGIMGYFGGIKGVYTCATGCVVTNDQDGNVETLGGTWTFNPDSDSAMVTQVTPDGQYLFFGWWQRSTTTARPPMRARRPASTRPRASTPAVWLRPWPESLRRARC